MIEFVKGNILNSNSEVIINTVNTVGVMGKGIALQFKKAYPDNFTQYKNACENGELKIGKLNIFETGKISPKYIINFPTKYHWRNPSKLSYIEDGLDELVRIVKEKDFKSIAIPPLGSGNGKLEWCIVKSLILNKLSTLSNIDIKIYEPGFKGKTEKHFKKIELNKLRSILLYSAEKFYNKSEELNLISIQKLSYFLQNLGIDLKLKFEKGWYGPYAQNLNKLLVLLNNHYLKFDSEENKPYTSVNISKNQINEINKYYDENVSTEEKSIVNQLFKLISGFESSYGLELLGTIDFVIKKNKTNDIEKIKAEIENWTNRKKKIMTDYHIERAHARLIQFQ